MGLLPPAHLYCTVSRSYLYKRMAVSYFPVFTVSLAQMGLTSLFEMGRGLFTIAMATTHYLFNFCYCQSSRITFAD